MRKIYALYQNEMIKISKKVSVIILLALMVVSVIGTGALFKGIELLQKSNSSIDMDYTENYKNQIDSNKTAIEDTKKALEKATTEEERNQLEATIAQLENYNERVQYFLDLNLSDNSENFLYAAVNTLFDNKSNMLTAQSIEEKAKYEANIASLEEIIKNKDYKAYINQLNKELEQSNKTDDEKKIDTENNELRLKCDPKGDYYNSAILAGTINYIRNYKLSLKRNIKYDENYMAGGSAFTPLSLKDRNDVENKLAVLEYKIDKGLLNLEEDSDGIKSVGIILLYSVGLAMIVLLALILGGSSVSQEMSTGSIKSLIVSPTKRWKIFVAKFLSLFTVGIIAILLMYFVALLTNLIFFGASTMTPYVFAVNGKAYEMSFAVYKLATVFIEYIDVFVYTAFAFMLSIITRNTAVAVGASIAIYYIGNSVSQIIILLFKGDWIKFIPFMNMSLSSRIFPDSTTNLLTGGISSLTGGSNISVIFSLAYLLVMLACIIYTAFDSFVRRDI